MLKEPERETWTDLALARLFEILRLPVRQKLKEGRGIRPNATPSFRVFPRRNDLVSRGPALSPPAVAQPLAGLSLFASSPS
jgi:hypothetical protein